MHNEENINLNVPDYRQTENFTCVPSCCKMILDYLNNEKLNVPESEFDEHRIAKIMHTTVSGTHFSKVENINMELTKSEPSVEFSAEFKPHTLDDIRKELSKKLPVAVWISTGSVSYFHSVVIIGIDNTQKTISYNDPIFGPKTLSQSEFVTKWEQQGMAYMIKVKIGRKDRYTLDSFTGESDNEKS